MDKHNLDKIPPGFRPVLWEEVAAGEIVFEQDKQGNAVGPCIVVDPRRFMLRKADGNTFSSNGAEVLLYRKGPLLVVHLLNQGYECVYCDVPLEIYIATLDDQVDGSSYRPLDFSEMPDSLRTHMNSVMPAGWPAMFGTWSVESTLSADQPDPEIAQVELRITGRVTATALCAELLREQHIFRCQPLDKTTFVFTMTRAVLNHITLHMQRLLPEENIRVS